MIYYIIIILIVIKIINYYRVSNETLEAKYEIEKLKDRLNWLSINGKVSKDDPLFIYLDNALKSSANQIHKSNFWVIVYLMFTDRSNVLYREQKAIEQHLSKNPEMEAIFHEFGLVSIQFLLSKSKISFFIVAFMLFVSKTLKNSFNLPKIYNSLRVKERHFKSIVIMTETHNPYCI